MTSTDDTLNPLVKARHRDTQTRKQRVRQALQILHEAGADITISSVARAAGVHRSFIHRHSELHAAVLNTAAAIPPARPAPAVSAASLQADLLNARQHSDRLRLRVITLESRLSKTLGQSVAQDVGLQPNEDLHVLRSRVAELEALIQNLRSQICDLTDDLDAARATNRELMTQLNITHAASIAEVRLR
ncbi:MULTISPECIES: hypothetical protein [unclassified Nonomuraea]|uniref:hypothetical protein n=1 Tax=unclassified Nonomuraea TaxID=2593643 RepID=UPI0034015608